MGIQNRGHQLMSRGKLPHISRRASAMSSSVIRTLYSSSDPSKPFNGFAGAPFSRSDSTNSSTARCLSGGNSRSFSSTSSGILMPGSVSILLRFPRSGNGNLRNVVAGLQTRAVAPLLAVGAGLFTLSEAEGPRPFLATTAPHSRFAFDFISPLGTGHQRRSWGSCLSSSSFYFPVSSLPHPRPARPPRLRLSFPNDREFQRKANFPSVPRFPLFRLHRADDNFLETRPSEQKMR